MQKAKPERQLETDERFSDAELTKLTQGVLDEQIGERAYDAKEAPNWLQKIVQEVLSRILERQPRFKVLVHGVLLQRVGAGLHTMSTCFWDPQEDRSVAIRWDNDTMYQYFPVTFKKYYMLRHAVKLVEKHFRHNLFFEIIHVYAIKY